LHDFLLILVQLQDYSLIAGSIGLFAILCLAMHLTRQVEWRSPGSQWPAGGFETAARP
jgi:inner membrane protein